MGRIWVSTVQTRIKIQDNGWKNALNNLRLIIQPLLLLCLIYPWLDIFPCANLLIGFNLLLA
jgi:hypothetical protein